MLSGSLGPLGRWLPLIPQVFPLSLLGCWPPPLQRSLAVLQELPEVVEAYLHVQVRGAGQR